MLNTVIQGDCLEKLQLLQDNSIHAIVTDPPYELGFMNKSWDSTGIAYSKELWSECLRVLRPGGHLLSFGGSRTYHRLAVAIEDSGFEIRDQIMWVYGSGFPKSLNIGKAYDKLMGNDRTVLPNISADGRNRGAEPSKGKRINSNVPISGGIERNEFTSKGFSEFEGLGTALKPAHEPIVLARKPLSEKSIVENCIKWDVGGLSIDECRIPIPDSIVRKQRYTGVPKFNGNVYHKSETTTLEHWEYTQGRFPANFIHDGSDEIVALFPNNIEGKDNFKHSATSIFGSKSNDNSYNGNSKSSYGSAARFFYCAKASKSERDLGCERLELKAMQTVGNGIGRQPNQDIVNNRNNHPTVKPIKLMEYLVKLVTRENQIVLDPFGGSGTTAIACMNTNRNYILIEKEPKYIEIIKNRIQGHANIFTEAV